MVDRVLRDNAAGAGRVGEHRGHNDAVGDYELIDRNGRKQLRTVHWRKYLVPYFFLSRSSRIFAAAVWIASENCR